jgi:hypothetical protein
MSTLYFDRLPKSMTLNNLQNAVHELGMDDTVSIIF